MPQQNGVVERKNRVVQDAVRSMLFEANLPKIFWREEVSVVVYIMKRSQLRVNSDKNLYKLWNGTPTSIKQFKIFGRKFYMKINDDNLSKFDSKEDGGIFLGYSSKMKSYKCYNKRIRKIMECVDVRVDEELPNPNP